MAEFMGQRSERAANSLALAEKLFAAIKTGREDDVEKYLCLGADPNCLLLNGITSFHLAAGCPRSSEFVKMILQYDGDPNVRDSDGITPLHVATMWGKIECLKLLYENGADITCKDKDGNDLKWFAQQNTHNGQHDISCLKLVEELFRCEKDKVTGTPSKTPYKVELNAHNDQISLKSPLHKLCDDSWIVKNRGSKRGRTNSGRSSKENSPLVSPAQSPCRRRPPDMKNLVSPYSPLPCCQNIHPRCEFIARQCPSVEDSKFQCIASNFHHREQTFCHHHTCQHIHHKFPDCAHTVSSCHCGHKPNSTSLKPQSNTKVTDDSVLDTTDKCVGTSMLGSFSENTDCNSVGVACQVTMNFQHQEDDLECSASGCRATDKHSPENPANLDDFSDYKAENVATNTNCEEKKSDGKSSKHGIESFRDSQTFNAAMAEFLRGCDRFVEADDTKGLNVSSPDHCVSFSLDKTTENAPQTSSQASRRAPREVTFVSDQKTTTKQAPPAAEKSPPATKCVNSTDLEQKEHLRNEISDRKCEASGRLSPSKKQLTTNTNIEKCLPETPRSSRFSPCVNMLLGTKIPLTPAEMLSCYGSTPPALSNESSTSQTVFSTNAPTAVTSLAQQTSDTTLSESTVPVVHSELLSSDASLEEKGGAQSTDAVIRGPGEALPKESTTEGDNNKCNTEKSNVPPTSIVNDQKKADTDCGPDEVFSTSLLPYPDTRASRLHSTAVDESHRVVAHAAQVSPNMSVIQGRCPQVSLACEEVSVVNLHQGEHGLSWTEESNSKQDRSKVTTEDVEQSSPLQLSSACSNVSSESTVLYDWKTFWKGETLPKSETRKSQKKTRKAKIQSTDSDLEAKNQDSKDIGNLTDNEIRDKLLSFGFTPGPISACREVYLKKLKDLLDPPPNGASQSTLPSTPKSALDGPQFSTEMKGILAGRSLPDSVVADEDLVRRQFEEPDPNLRWREGTTKNSFTYLLLDPRATHNLPGSSKNLSELQTFRMFVGAIFYVGKGKQSRPYSHFREALQTNVMHYKLNPSQKVRHIHDIWSSGFGVVSLHVFQSVVACEAYTREAAMIEAIGLNHLTNRKRGEFYGVASSWDSRRKRIYGTFLLMKAMKVLLLEGERQIRPANLKSNSAKQWTGCQAPVPVS